MKTRELLVSVQPWKDFLGIVRYNKTTVVWLVLAFSFSSCIHSGYYRRVRKNIKEFEVVAAHFKKNPPNVDCIYPDAADSLSKKLMTKYRLKRICVNSTSHMLISFHRNYNPMLGKADVIYCDFGKSERRDNLTTGTKNKHEKLKPINNSFIYALYPDPMFGF